jgi:hypothetical protein
MNVGESLKQFLCFIAGSIIQGVSLLMHMIFSDLREIVVINPFDPKRVCFNVYVPKLFGQEAHVPGLNIQKSQTTFVFRKTYTFPSHKSRCISQSIPSP